MKSLKYLICSLDQEQCTQSFRWTQQTSDQYLIIKAKEQWNIPSAFTPTKLWTFCLLFKAHRDLNLFLRLSCDVAGSDGYFSSIRAGLWSSVPVGPGQGSMSCCAGQPDLLHLCPLSLSLFQAPHSVVLTQWLVKSHPKWAWGAHKPILLISLLLPKFSHSFF